MNGPLLTIVGIALAFAAGVLVGWLASKHTREQPQTPIAEEADGRTPEVKANTQSHAERQPQPRPVTELGMHLFVTPDVTEELHAWLRNVRKRQAGDNGTAPNAIELFLARKLEESGIGDGGLSLPNLKVVRPHTNGMFYLRLPKGDVSYGDTLSMYSLEAALNAGVLAEELFRLRPPEDEEEIFAALDTLGQRITAQIDDLSAPPREGDGEWAARLALSHAIECLRLPYRLIANFRMNLADGVAAIEFETTPAEVFPRSALVNGAGIVPTTSDMRAKALTDYTIRLTALLAECAFAASEGISHVWIAAIERTPESHACLVSADFDRKTIEGFTGEPIPDVESLFAFSDAKVRLENGRLLPVTQDFSLDDERFCPPCRYEPVGLSIRTLDPQKAEALGSVKVSDLEIDEAARRERMAEDVAKSILDDGTTTCEEAVRAVLALSVNTDDESLRRSATRTAQRLVEGTLDPEPMAILEALCDDEGLVDAVTSAQELLANGQYDEAADIMRRALAPLDAVGAYSDTQTDEWRGFSSYVDRVLYNLKFAREGVITHLVPEAYIEAIITLSMALLASGNGDEALKLARRASAICPMGAIVRLHLIQCLDYLGYSEESRQQLVMLLLQAHDPEGLGFGYYRLAMSLFQEGKTGAARAAYQRAMAFMPQGANDALRAMGIFIVGPGIVTSRELTQKEMERTLAAEGIPFAPTEEISQAFMKAARASLDAEIFPVARDFMRVLGAISKDDVLFGVFRSLEDEPDR